MVINLTRGKGNNMKKIETIGTICLLVFGSFLSLNILLCENASAATWTISNVEGAINGDGVRTSIAVGSTGYPSIAYTNFNAKDLRYASWTGSAWAFANVDTAGDVGRWPSLDLDTSGYPHISYCAYDVGYLKQAKWTGSSWVAEDVDDGGFWGGDVGYYTAIAVDNTNRVHISHVSWVSYSLLYARFNGTTWTRETVDSTADCKETSIATDNNGYPHISYRDFTASKLNLKYAKWTGSAWSVQEVDTTGDTGWNSSIAVDSSGNAHISYVDLTNHDLKYAKWSGTGWVLSTVDSASFVSEATDIALDSTGKPVIIYYDNSTGDLKLAKYNGATWDIETVDSSGDVGYKSSVAIDASGIVHISYLDITNGQLKYAKSQPLVTVPGAPQSVIATAGSSQVALSWTAPASNGGASITGYKVYRGTTSGGETLLVTIGNLLTYTDSSVTNGQIYYYKVSAVNSAGEGVQSNEVSATPAITVTVPSAPTNLQATAGNSQVILGWSAPASNGGASITGYKMYRGTTSGGETLLASLGNVLTYTNSALTNGQIYYYKVSAVNSAGEGAKSTSASATPTVPPTGTTISSAPRNLQAVAGDAQVTLSWIAPSSDGGATITGYMVYRGSLSGSETLLASIGNVLTYADNGVTNNNTYYYKVIAVNSVGESPYSSEVSVIPIGVDDNPADDDNSGGIPGFELSTILIAALMAFALMAIYQRRKK
jgi:fibronectin type 3 domain-containing protein